jgi:hypothetical protein
MITFASHDKMGSDQSVFLAFFLLAEFDTFFFPCFPLVGEFEKNEVGSTSVPHLINKVREANSLTQ